MFCKIMDGLLLVVWDLSTSAGLILWALLISCTGVSLTSWAAYTLCKMLMGQSRANHRGVIKLGQQI